MSRVGQAPVQIPSGVTVEFAGKVMTAKGKLGTLSLALSDDVETKVADGELTFALVGDTIRARKLWGTYRALAQNMVKGVSEGYKRELQINGVGYRAAMQGKELVLQLGYSHEVRYPVPEGIKIETPTQTEVNISGADKQKVGAVAAVIRSFRGPEPYKGKGIKYKDEQILRKEGKKK
jgi:large subunit ribosomal protein L6